MKPSLLLVDTDSLLTLMLTEYLERHGFACRFACEGSEALRELEHEVPDLLIVDRALRRMSGDELIRRVRANPRTAHVPVIILTDLDPIEHPLIGFHVPEDDYLRKPLSAARLLQRIAAHSSTLVAA